MLGAAIIAYTIVEFFYKENSTNRPKITEAESAVRYAQRIGHRYPKGEPIILTDPEWTYWYARNVIRGAWIAGESVLAQDSELAYWYIKGVIAHDDVAIIRFKKLWKHADEYGLSI